MSDQDTLVFADRDMLFPAPVIDGFFDRDFMITNEPVETGYVGGSLMTLGASGIPPVIFQGVRLADANPNSDRLIFAFLCRFSQPIPDPMNPMSFLNTIGDDEIVIALKSSFVSGSEADVRLIVINPVGTGGALGAAGSAGSAGAANDIRNNRTPRQALFYKSDGPESWIPASPTGIDVKVRSWNPSPGMGADELAWSVEVSVPRTAAGGGGAANWIDIQNDFGLYFALTKIVGVGGGMASQYVFPIGSGSFPGFYDTNPLSDFPFGHGIVPMGAAPASAARGVYFMPNTLNGWQGIGQRAVGSSSLSPGHQIQATNNEIVALLGNDGTASAGQVQIDFAMAHWGLPSGNPNFWTRPEGLLPVKIPVGGQTVANAATNVVFKSDPWTLDNMTLNYKGSGKTQRKFFEDNPHQCMWAQATALTTGVNFKQASVRRNMDFIGLSDVERDAVVSGEGYDDPPNGKADHDFILQTFCRKVIVQEVVKNVENVEDDTKQLLGAALQAGRTDDTSDNVATMAASHVAGRRGGGTQFKDSVVYIWITMGYRITDLSVIVAGKKYPLLDNGCGSFGFVAHHTGVADNLSWSFSGPGLGRFSSGVYGLKVPHKGATTIGLRLSAEPDGPMGDSSKELPKLDPKEWVPDVGGGRPDNPNPGDSDPKPDPTPKPGICGLIALGIVGVPLAFAATQLFA
ncbi:MAG: hypothetical protein ABL928_03460 [Sphingorhabdus sp.]